MSGQRTWSPACALAGLGLTFLPASCGGKQAPSAPPPQVVSVGAVTQNDVPVYSEYIGTLDAYVNADARARVQGMLLEQHYTEGSRVKAGQLLFVIDPKPFEAAKLQAEGALAQAKAALEKANADVARDTPLVAKQAVSQQDLDNAIASRDSAIGQVASAQGQLQTAVLNLGYTRVISPVRSAEITGTAAPGYSSGQVMKALEEVAREVLSPDYSYAWTALSYQEASAPSSVPTFLLALLVVFLILAALYESWSLPLGVLLGAAPVAAFCAFFALYVTKTELDVYSQIGLIMLVGLSSKNAILIVEFLKTQLEEGKSPLDAALAGADLRLRPILMTSFAFIFGLVPLLLASGSGAQSQRILGTVVVLGMAGSTLIAVFVTPSLFVGIERLVVRARRPRGGAASAPTPTPMEAE